MKFDLRVQLIVAVAGLPMSALVAYAVSNCPPDHLASVASFASIGATSARSAALFTELGKVLTHPRCVNCHPAGDDPRQGDDSRLHQPPVERGPERFCTDRQKCVAKLFISGVITYRLDRSPGPIVEAGCWVHARPPFFAMADLEENALRQAVGDGEFYRSVRGR